MAQQDQGKREGQRNPGGQTDRQGKEGQTRQGQDLRPGAERELNPQRREGGSGNNPYEEGVIDEEEEE